MEDHEISDGTTETTGRPPLWARLLLAVYVFAEKRLGDYALSHQQEMWGDEFLLWFRGRVDDLANTVGLQATSVLIDPEPWEDNQLDVRTYREEGAIRDER